MLRRLMMSLFALAFVTGLAACGDTWEGAKQDTGENLQKSGDTIEDAGEDIKD